MNTCPGLGDTRDSQEFTHSSDSRLEESPKAGREETRPRPFRVSPAWELESPAGEGARSRVQECSEGWPLEVLRVPRVCGVGPVYSSLVLLWGFHLAG